MSEQHNTKFSKKLLEHIKKGRNSKAKAMLTPALSQESNGFGTLLHYAAMYDNVVIARQLIRLGADIDRLGHDNKTPLMLAVDRQCSGTVNYLLKAGANIDIVNVNGRTALKMLFEQGHFQKKFLLMFEEILRAKWPNNEDLYDKLRNNGLTMYEAALFDDLDLMQYMLDSGADIDSPGYFRLTALHSAVEQNNLQLTEWLIGKNANVNVRDEEGFTPLLLSVVVPVKKAILKLLLEHGADPNIGTYETGESPLYALAVYEEPIEDVIECMQLLCEHGAIPNNLKDYDKTIFEACLKSVNPKRVKYLVAQTVFLEKMGIPIDVAGMRCDSSVNRTKFKELVVNHKRVLNDVAYKKLSLFDLLTASKCRMKKYGRDKTFIPNIQRFCRRKALRTMYPYYCEILVKRIDEAVDIVELEDIAIPIVCKLFDSHDDAFYIAAKKIVEYLDKESLDKLSEV